MADEPVNPTPGQPLPLPPPLGLPYAQPDRDASHLRTLAICHYVLAG